METNSIAKQALREALGNFFDLEELYSKALRYAAENYVYEHNMTISDGIMEKLEMGLEETFDDLIDEVIESLLWD